MWWQKQKSDEVKPSNPLSGFSRDEINRAALHLIHHRIPFCFPAYLGGSISQCDNALRVIADIRTEYNDYEPKIMRREVMGWLDFYKNEAEETKRDVETQKSKKDLDAYRENCYQENDKVSDILDAIQRTKG